jgi:hypothetical protein
MLPLPQAVQQRLDRRKGKKWDSFSWITMRALVSSVNHAVNLGAPGLVPNLREQWGEHSGDAEEAGRIICLDHVDRFIVIGDPGEQDASQYVLVPQLEEASESAGFILICSDVIYPSGDVNDYVDGFYLPYENLCRPIYALPGNHDWYDGLAGFMRHFCDRQPLANTAYAEGATSVRERIYRHFWRHPSKPKETELAEAPTPRTRGPSDPLQPGSYFAIETKHLLLVCIDTGINGDIDQAQALWLMQLPSCNSKPKVLLTGKPLVVDMQRKPHGIVDATGKLTSVGVCDNVDDIIRRPESGYVAAVGGDIHNYQHYAFDGIAGRHGFHYVVSGGGGAFMSATHPIPPCTGTGQIGCETLTQPPDLYPTREDSLRYFADRLLPRLWRLVRAIIALLLSLVAATAWALTSDDQDQTARFAAYCALAFAGVIVVQMVLAGEVKRRGLYRGFVVVAAVVAGVTIGLAAWWLEPGHYATSAVAWAGLTAGGALLAWAMRRTGWWRKTTPCFSLNRFWWLIAGAATIAIPVAVFCLTGDWALRLTASAIAVGATSGWIARRKDNWSQTAALVVAGVSQLVGALVILDRLVVPASARGAFCAAVAAAFLPALAAFGIPALLAWLPTPGARSATFKDQMFTYVPTVGLLSTLTAATAVIWIAAETSSDAGRVAALCLAAMLSLPAFVFGVDALRRRFGRRFPPLALLFVAGAVALCQWRDVDVLPGWMWRGVAATVIIAFVTLLGIVIVHLVFLGAHTMAWHCGSHREVSQLTDEQAADILAWRAPGPSQKPDPKARWVANIVFPGSTNPHGPIQRFVAEIFDSDKPPFFKHFLVLESTDECLSVAPQAVTGCDDSKTKDSGLAPFKIDLHP